VNDDTEQRARFVLIVILSCAAALAAIGLG
jgi:hypothetical protein